ncbi:MAG: tol-pal system protein YbgF [Rhodoferax sp.]|nr:tol-pal system protein YbgF [Rhodoferax sp.]
MPIFALRAVFAAVCCLCISSAQAGLFEDDEARRAILELRQKVDQMQQQSAQMQQQSAQMQQQNVQMQQQNAEQLSATKNENAVSIEQVNAQLTQLRRSLLELSNMIEGLRSELANSRGKSEQLARDLADAQRQQKDIVQGTEDRLKRLEPSKVSVDGLEFMALPAEIRDYDSALATMRKGDFAQALPAFSEFVRRYPASGYQPSALFWLGNLNYSQRNYKEALNHYRALVSASPAHLRAPEAMLSIANCQLELKDARASRKTLEELVKDYAESEAASLAKGRLAKMK